MSDELFKPLKGRSKHFKDHWKQWFFKGMAGLLGLLIVFLIGWIILVDDPEGGKPTISLALNQITSQQDEKTAEILKQDEDHNIIDNLKNKQQPNIKNDDKARALEALQSRGINPRIISVPQEINQKETREKPPLSREERLRNKRSQAQRQTQQRGLSVEPARDLIEKTASGNFLPRIGRRGQKPMDAYARPFEINSSKGRLPKIALIISGLGLSQTTTQKAIEKLPSDITLAYAPYGNSLERWVTRSREKGFEHVLQMPMEPFDYPNNDPGPHTLLVESNKDENIKKTQWVMGRTKNYVGMMNYMGARFTASDQAFSSYLQEMNTRGLLYIDDGSSARSLTTTLAKSRPDIIKAQIIIDQRARQEEIDNRLLQLEAIAREQGFAVGVGSALPITIDQVSKWSQTLSQRGFVLVPITAIMNTKRQTISQ